jgi:hypothetical protein
MPLAPSDTPERFKSRDDFSMDEELAMVQAARRGELTPRFERDEYKRFRRDALTEAGLEPDEADAEPVPLEEQTTEEHFDRLRAGRQ